MAKQKIIKSLADLQPDQKNLNRHTRRGASMMETSIREAERLGALSVDAFALNPQWYVDRGFVIVGSNPFGAVHVRKEIART